MVTVRSVPTFKLVSRTASAISAVRVAEFSSPTVHVAVPAVPSHDCAPAAAATRSANTEVKIFFISINDLSG